MQDAVIVLCSHCIVLSGRGGGVCGEAGRRVPAGAGGRGGVDASLPCRRAERGGTREAGRAAGLVVYPVGKTAGRAR